MIPFIAPEFPQAQRDAMSFGTKVPVVYAMVQLSNWRAWQRLGTLRDQLTRLLGPGGFDPARDIRAITINRWGHGYALEYGRPWATFWPDGPLPFELARKPLNRITVANSDSQGRAYADAAIDAAHRAVTELPGVHV